MIDPRYMSMREWTDATVLTLSTLAPLPRLMRDDWQSWAFTVIQTPAIAAYSPPDPRGLTDWRQWAERFVECVPL